MAEHEISQNNDNVNRGGAVESQALNANDYQMGAAAADFNKSATEKMVENNSLPSLKLDDAAANGQNKGAGSDQKNKENNSEDKSKNGENKNSASESDPKTKEKNAEEHQRGLSPDQKTKEGNEPKTGPGTKSSPSFDDHKNNNENPAQMNDGLKQTAPAQSGEGLDKHDSVVSASYSSDNKVANTGKNGEKQPPASENTNSPNDKAPGTAENQSAGNSNVSAEKSSAESQIAGNSSVSAEKSSKNSAENHSKSAEKGNKLDAPKNNLPQLEIHDPSGGKSQGGAASGKDAAEPKPKVKSLR